MLVVDMMPLDHSGETAGDAEPNVAVNPADPSIICASAFTKDTDPNATSAPIYTSSDGGMTWSLKSIVPDTEGTTEDITLRFSGSNRLYIAYLASGGGDDGGMHVARTADLTFATKATVLSKLDGVDQPYVEAATAHGTDRVYVGNRYNFWAAMHYSLDAAAASPTFRTVQLEVRDDIVDLSLPPVRTAIHPSGVIYAAFYGHLRAPDPDPQLHRVTVVRDDDWGNGASPFTSLLGTDGRAGVVVADQLLVQQASFGQEREGGELSIAVDPNDAATVYLAWADSTSGIYTVHVRRSKDHGKTWPEELRTIPWCQNPALSVAADGTIGFVYQQYVAAIHKGSHRWVTHFQTSSDGTTWIDTTLATVPADAPPPDSETYIGDYLHLMSVGNDFYGVFSANNTPDANDFPASVVYQRNRSFATHTLLDVDNTTPVAVSIDAFFFKQQRVQLGTPAKVYQLAAEVLFGVIQDGGGVVKVGNHVIKIPPWDPEGGVRRIVHAVGDYLLAESLSDRAEASALRERALEVLQRVL